MAARCFDVSESEIDFVSVTDKKAKIDSNHTPKVQS